MTNMAQMPESLASVLRPMGWTEDLTGEKLERLIKQCMLHMAAIGDDKRYHKFESYLNK